MLVKSFFADDVAFVISLIPVALLSLIVIASAFESKFRVLKAKALTIRVRAGKVI